MYIWRRLNIFSIFLFKSNLIFFCFLYYSSLWYFYRLKSINLVRLIITSKNQPYSAIPSTGYPELIEFANGIIKYEFISEMALLKIPPSHLVHSNNYLIASKIFSLKQLSCVPSKVVVFCGSITLECPGEDSQMRGRF